MEHACKMLSMAAGLILTCLVIGFGMITYRESMRFGMEVMESLNNLTDEYAWYEWERYEDARVSGGEVVSVIRRYQKEIPVSVVQKQKTYTYNGGFKLSDNVPAKAGYIRYGDVYIGKVLYDANENLDAICFYLQTD